MKLSYSHYTDVGGRGNNEDALAVAVAPHGYLFLVADGLGGHDNGEEASFLAVEEIKRRFLEDGVFFDPEKAIISANNIILAKQREEGSSMKTTITLAWVGDVITRFAHVGDSRIYVFGEEGIIYQSPDHSVSQMAVAMGEITLGGIRSHRDRNKLTRALGVSEEVVVHLNALNNSEYKAILMCSDGLWEYVYEKEMVSLLSAAKSPDEWIAKMRELHGGRVDGSHDNNTAVAVIAEKFEGADTKRFGTTKNFSAVSARPSAPAQPVRQQTPAAPAPVHAARPAPLARGGAVPDDYKSEKTNKTVLALVIVAVFLLVVIGGLLAFMLLSKGDESDGKNGSSVEQSAEQSTEGALSEELVSDESESEPVVYESSAVEGLSESEDGESSEESFSSEESSTEEISESSESVEETESTEAAPDNGIVLPDRPNGNGDTHRPDIPDESQATSSSEDSSAEESEESRGESDEQSRDEEKKPEEDSKKPVFEESEEKKPEEE